MAKKTGDSDARFVWRIVDDEAMIVHLDSGGLFSLDRIGTEVWTALQDGVAPAEIVATIAGKYGVDEQVVQRDVSDLLADLARAGLVD